MLESIGVDKMFNELIKNLLRQLLRFILIVFRLGYHKNDKD